MDLIVAVTVFVLALFVGYEIITLVGAIIAAGAEHAVVAAILGVLAVILGTINVVGGFLVTHRMLEMFRRKH
jgi:NAD(P) transhydrogenase subunit alpha